MVKNDFSDKNLCLNENNQLTINYNNQIICVFEKQNFPYSWPLMEKCAFTWLLYRSTPYRGFRIASFFAMHNFQTMRFTFSDMRLSVI